MFRTHASLDGNTPAEISGDSVAQPAPLNSYAWESIAAVCSNFRLQLELQFAMHTFSSACQQGLLSRKDDNANVRLPNDYPIPAINPHRAFTASASFCCALPN
jgi:hypothetical protein